MYEEMSKLFECKKGFIKTRNFKFWCLSVGRSFVRGRFVPSEQRLSVSGLGELLGVSDEQES